MDKKREVFLDVNFRRGGADIRGDEGDDVCFTRLGSVDKACEGGVKCVSEDKEQENRNKPQGGQKRESSFWQMESKSRMKAA